MKTRNGFVSNSSSSSFLLFLGQVPKSVEETKALLFSPNQTEYINPYIWDDTIEREWPIETVSEIVFSDIETFMNYTEKEKQECIHMELEDIACNFSQINIRDLEAYTDFLDYWYRPIEKTGYIWLRKEPQERKPLYDLIFDEHIPWPREGASPEEYEAYRDDDQKRNLEYDRLCSEYVQKIKDRLPTNKIIVKLEYSDNDGTLRCAMEHGNLFKNVSHIKVSHH